VEADRALVVVVVVAVVVVVDDEGAITTDDGGRRGGFDDVTAAVDSDERVLDVDLEVDAERALVVVLAFDCFCCSGGEVAGDEALAASVSCAFSCCCC
jgi:hypothetical protein